MEKRLTGTSFLFFLGVVAILAGSAIAKDCKKSYIEISQAPTPQLPSGIPTYTVEISNVCPSGCNISSIHVACGSFSSAILINPNIFKRLTINDCLVNGGKPLLNGHIISFKYATTFSYPLSVSSLACQPHN